MFVERREGLLVPADSDAGREVADAKKRRAQLQAARELISAERQHELMQLAADAEYRAALADLAERTAAAETARKERAKDAAADAKLGRLYRRVINTGTRLQLRANMLGSAEKRAERVARVRTAVLSTLIPALLGFAFWSIAGVQAGAVRLGRLENGEPLWWAAWTLEPALIAVVALIIIVRAVLRSAGGDVDWRATVAEWAALTISLLLNLFGAWEAPGWAGFGNALMHSVGPLGCAGVAFLIGVLDDCVAKAKPWEGAQRLAEMDMVAARQVRKTIDELPPVAQSVYALDAAQFAPPDEQVTHSGSAQEPRKSGAHPGRVKQATHPSTSGNAPGEDAATQAAKDFLKGKFGSRREAAAHHGVSDGSVRNRLKAFESGTGYAPHARGFTHPQTNGHPILNNPEGVR